MDRLPLPHLDGGELVLVTGCDATGKSTLINQLMDQYPDDYVAVEPTSWSSDAREFKTANLRTPIDEYLIDNRESLYLRLHRQFSQEVRYELNKGSNVVTTASPIITRTAHATMRKVIGSTGEPIESLVDKWIKSGENIPSTVIHLDAPMDIIRSRIQDRMKSGQDHTEINWGFNALFYLSHYRTALMRAAQAIGRAGIKSMVFDTSQTKPEQIISWLTAR
jgi:thymidylate kinase